MTTNTVVPNLNEGKTLVVFSVGDKICSLVKDCPTLGAENIPKELAFQFPYCLAVVNKETQGIEYILVLEKSMFGTTSYALIDSKDHRENLGVSSGDGLTEQKFIRTALFLINENKNIWEKKEIYGISRSISPSEFDDERIDSKLNFFQKMKFKKRVNKFKENSKPIFEITRDFIHQSLKMSESSLSQIKRWDLDNERLTTFIAYIYGAVGTAAFAHLGRNNESHAIINAIMVAAISAAFRDLPLTNYFVESVENTVANWLISEDKKYAIKSYCFGNDINFELKAANMGGEDLKHFVSDRKSYSPVGLDKLGFITIEESQTIDSAQHHEQTFRLDEVSEGFISALYELINEKWIRSEVASWSMENKFLLVNLGHLAGIIYACQEHINQEMPKNPKARELLFNETIKKYYSGIPRADLWINLNELNLKNEDFEFGQIDSLHYYPEFEEGFKSGYDFYRNVTNNKANGKFDLSLDSLRVAKLHRKYSNHIN